MENCWENFSLNVRETNNISKFTIFGKFSEESMEKLLKKFIKIMRKIKKNSYLEARFFPKNKKKCFGN